MADAQAKRRVLTGLWFVATAYYVFAWRMGEYRPGVGQVLARWSVLGLPLFLTTALVRYGGNVWQQVGNVGLPITLWIALLALMVTHFDVESSSHWGQVVGEVIVFLVLVFPIAVLIGGFRLLRGIAPPSV